MNKIRLRMFKLRNAAAALNVAAALIFAGGFAHCGSDKAGGEKAGYYTCSMHPQVISQEPGNCPICGMKLTYVEGSQESKDDDEHKDHDHDKDSADMKDMESAEKKEGKDGNFRFNLSRTIIRNANIATAPVQIQDFSAERKFSAHLDYSEEPNRLVIISPKYDGWIEQLFVSKEGQYVQKGQALIGVYSPSILAAKEEYVTTYNTIKSLYEAQGKPPSEVLEDPTVQAARQKLVLLDVSNGQIEKLEQTGKATRRVFYYSPISGVVTKKNVLQGAHIKSGQEILRIANLFQLWAFFHVFEKDLSYVKKGQQVTISTQSYTDKTYKGTVDLVYPFVNPETKDVKVRVVINNPKLELKPGMFAEVNLKSQLATKGVVIPDTAVIFSGDKNYVFVSLGNGQFEVRPVKHRAASDGLALIGDGLEKGDLVVVNGQFLLDSEASLKEAIVKGGMAGHQH